MKEIEFDVTLQVKELFAFTMRHTYYSVSGVFSLFISLASLLLCLLKFREFEKTTIGVLLFIALLFLVIQPVVLYVKCALQKKRSSDIHAQLHYCLSEEGISVRQGEQTAFVHWYDVRRVVRAGGGLYLYLSPVRAFIFPKSQCGGRYEAVEAAVRRPVDKYRDYVPEEEQPEQAEEKEP